MYSETKEHWKKIGGNYEQKELQNLFLKQLLEHAWY